MSASAAGATAIASPSQATRRTASRETSDRVASFTPIGGQGRSSLRAAASADRNSPQRPPPPGDPLCNVRPMSSPLLERLAQGPVICAEGYLFEFERRGYLQAGAFVPEIVLEEPGLVEGLSREFVHAGSDVVEAFTYYGHREKLRVIDKEHLLEPL